MNIVRMRTSLATVSIAAATALALAACGGSTSDSGSPTAPTSAAASSPSASASASASADAAVAVVDPWVKASEGPMTAAFATLVNAGDTPVTVVSATTSASDVTELHEVVMVDGEMQMQPKPGGIVIPAGGEHLLEPGADHIMIMGMTSPIVPGAEVTVTLTLDSGETVTFTAIAKDFAGADEEYHGGDMDMGHSS